MTIRETFYKFIQTNLVDKRLCERLYILFIAVYAIFPLPLSSLLIVTWNNVLDSLKVLMVLYTGFSYFFPVKESGIKQIEIPR